MVVGGGRVTCVSVCSVCSGGGWGVVCTHMQCVGEGWEVAYVHAMCVRVVVRGVGVGVFTFVHVYIVYMGGEGLEVCRARVSREDRVPDSVTDLGFGLSLLD